MPAVSIKWIPKAFGSGGHLELLDQTKLPLATHWIKCDQADAVIDAIKRLAVRGAPAIGIAGAYAYCLAAQQAIEQAADSEGVVKNGKAVADRIGAQAELIAAARPTAVNLRWAVNRMDSVRAKYAFRVCSLHDLTQLSSFMPNSTWMKDEEATVCAVPSCGKSFNLLERKHHCRMCGQVVCNACTKQVVVFANGPDPIRCCSRCIAAGRDSAGPEEIMHAMCREVNQSSLSRPSNI